MTDDGYVIVTGMMSGEDVQAARDDLGRVLESTKTGRNFFEGFSTQRVYALFAKTRTFDQAATHPLLLGVLDEVLGQYQLSAPVGIRIGPGEKAQILTATTRSTHCPNRIPPSWSTRCGRSIPSPRRTARPGSSQIATAGHQDGTRPRPMRWRSRRWSRARPVLPGQPLARRRREPDRAAEARRDPGVRVILAAAAGESLPGRAARHCPRVARRLQELLGYNIYPPFVGYVDGAHPRKVLAKDE